MSINTSKLAKELASDINTMIEERMGRYPVRNPKSLEEQIEARLEEKLAKTGWQPIETAPGDGTTIDTYCDWAHLREVNVHWDQDALKWVRFDESEGWEECFPTHWMPIPDAPKDEAARKKGAEHGE